jgi:hypothetical protein
MESKSGLADAAVVEEWSLWYFFYTGEDHEDYISTSYASEKDAKKAAMEHELELRTYEDAHSCGCGHGRHRRVYGIGKRYDFILISSG